MDERDGFEDALLAAPLGAAVLARIAADASRVDADAGEWVRAESLGWFLGIALWEASNEVGPWVPGAPTTVAAAYRQRDALRPVAAAVDERFGDALHAPVDLDAQEWWGYPLPAGYRPNPAFRGFSNVYDAGQITWAALRTVTSPPTAIHGELVSSWELPPPASRWRLPVRHDARVWEVHRPADWARLVRTFPAVGGQCGSWELPGPNQHVEELAELLTIPGQHAARTRVLRHLVPDWAKVATRFDGVHLSWAGFLTAEGYVTDLGAGDVAMLRYWSSEWTHWLADVFGDPEPLSAPALERGKGVDARTDDAARERDAAVLAAALDRPVH